MIVYRLCRASYAGDLSGKGAELSGGRWNSKGVAMVYTSESRALCMAEVAVHLPLGLLPTDYVMTLLNIPVENIYELPKQDWPPDWKSFPYSSSTRRAGDRFISEGKYPVMKVPSAVVEGDFNFLLNPKHPDFRKVFVAAEEPFNVDKRFYQR